jgi:hypothetical protein
VIWVGWGVKAFSGVEDAYRRIPPGFDDDDYIISEDQTSQECQAKNIRVEFELPHFLCKVEAIDGELGSPDEQKADE